MQLVIDISEDDYRKVQDGRASVSMMRKAIRNGTPLPRCKDCKWWKDSDGLYRRGAHAESQCPINRRKVFEGNGYCYMFEPQERERV